MRARNHSSVPFVITNVHRRETWPSTLHQFMRARNHSSVLFAITNIHKRWIWQGTLHLFMRARNHLSVECSIYVRFTSYYFLFQYKSLFCSKIGFCGMVPYRRYVMSGDLSSTGRQERRWSIGGAAYTQYCAIRNGLIRNSTEIFTNFKKRVLKIFGIRNDFFSLMDIKKRTILRTLELRNQYAIFGNFSDFFWNFLIFSKIFQFSC